MIGQTGEFPRPTSAERPTRLRDAVS